MHGPAPAPPAIRVVPRRASFIIVCEPASPGAARTAGAMAPTSNAAVASTTNRRITTWLGKTISNGQAISRDVRNSPGQVGGRGATHRLWSVPHGWRLATVSCTRSLANTTVGGAHWRLAPPPQAVDSTHAHRLQDLPDQRRLADPAGDLGARRLAAGLRLGLDLRPLRGPGRGWRRQPRGDVLVRRAGRADQPAPARPPGAGQHLPPPGAGGQDGRDPRPRRERALRAGPWRGLARGGARDVRHASCRRSASGSRCSTPRCASSRRSGRARRRLARRPAVPSCATPSATRRRSRPAGRRSGWVRRASAACGSWPSGPTAGTRPATLDLRREARRLLRHCEAVGRDPAEIEISAQAFLRDGDHAAMLETASGFARRRPAPDPDHAGRRRAGRAAAAGRASGEPLRERFA